MRSITAVQRTPSMLVLVAAVIVALGRVAEGAPPPPAPSTPPAAPSPSSPASASAPPTSPAPSASSTVPAPSAPPAETAPPPSPPPPSPPPAPPPAPASPPAAAPAPAPSPKQAERPKTTAYVHLFATYPNAQLELRSSVDDTGWRAVCRAPCDRDIDVDSTEARVTAPGMTSSNTFLIEPGRGTASFKVNGGSAQSKQIGVISLASGLGVALAGMGVYGVGFLDEDKGVKTAGIVTMAVGGAAVLASLPLLSIGSTRVQNSKGKTVARRAAWSPPPL